MIAYNRAQLQYRPPLSESDVFSSVMHAIKCLSYTEPTQLTCQDVRRRHQEVALPTLRPNCQTMSLSRLSP